MRYVGTVLTKELNEVSKRRRTFVFRALMPAIMLIVLLFWLESFRNTEIYYQSQAGKGLFYSIAYILLSAVFLLTPAYCAPLISSERERQTLETIRSTPIRSCELILGKISSRILLLILVSVGVIPVMFVCLMFGGVSPLEIVMASGIIISNIFLCAGLSILFSTLTLKSSRAISRTYVLLIMVGILSFVFLFVKGHTLVWSGAASVNLFSEGIFFGICTLTLLAMNPFIMLSVLSMGAMPGGSVANWFLFAGIGGNLAFFLVSIFLSSLILKRTTYWEKGSFLRILLMGDRLGRKSSQKSGKPSKRKIPKFGRNPVYWKECIESVLTRPSAKIKSVLIICVPFLLLYVLTLFLWPSLWFVTFAPYYRTGEMRIPHIAFIVGEFAIAYFVTIASASGSVVKERSKKTLDALLMTPLSSRSIWLGKFMGVCKLSTLFFMVPIMHISLCIFHGILGFHALWLTLITVSIVFLFFIVAGISLSIKCRKRTTAIVSTLLVAFTVFGAIPIIAGIVEAHTWNALDGGGGEMIVSLSPWYWIGYPLINSEFIHFFDEFFEFGIGYFWFLMVYGLITVVLAITFSKSLRERLAKE